MGAGGYVALGIGALAIGVVIYFLVKNNSTPTAPQARPAQPQNQTLATVGQVSTAVGALANLGSTAINAYES